MTMDAHDIIKRARRLGRQYAQRVSGAVHAEADDLAGAAMLEQVNAANRFDPERGHWANFAHAAAARGIRHEMRLSYPVSGVASRKANTHEKLRLISQTHIDETPSHDEPRAKRGHTPSSSASTEASASITEIRDRLVELLGEGGAAFALALLTGEVRPAELAAEEGVPVLDINAAQRRVRKKLQNDARLRELWSEL